MEKDIRILLVDDHQVVRDGLRRMLELEPDFKVVGEAANAEEALAQVELLVPEVILMDIKMPGVDGVELTRQVKQKCPSCNVIVLTLYNEYLAQAVEAGAAGYLLKDVKREELVRVIRQVRHGEAAISESITHDPRNGYKERLGEKAEEGTDAMVEEVQIVIPPPVEANQLMRFASQLEEVLQSRVLQVVGSWQEGTALIIILSRAISLADILNRLGKIPGIQTVQEEPLAGENSLSLLRKASTIPRLRGRLRKTIFVSLKKG